MVGSRHCVAGPLAARSPSQEGRERGPLRRQEKFQIDGASSGRSTDLIPYTDPDAVGTHHSDTAELECLREIDDYLAI